MPHYYNYSEPDLRELDELKANLRGVVRKNSAAAMSDTSKILVVGLGGMGLETVHELKKTLISRVGELRDSDIQFLTFDTDRKDIGVKRENGPLTDQETPILFSRNLQGVMRQDESLRAPSFRDPMPPSNSGYSPTFAGMGAGQVRLTGRLSIMDNETYEMTLDKLKSAITQLGDFTSKNLDVHVISGVGGGTGSGLCVDMPYIIRHAADIIHVPAANRRIFGHIYLPNAYDTVLNVNLPKAYRNGYAALKEIDYYMSIDAVHETFDAIYPDGNYSSEEPVFQFCTLIGGHSSEALVSQNTKKEAVSTCVENLVNQVTHAIKSDDNASMTDYFSSQSFMDNVAAHLSTVMERGDCNFHESGNYKYNYIGSATLQFPTDAVIEYFTGEVFKRTVGMLNDNVQKLTTEDVNAFEKGIAAPLYLINGILSKYEQKAAEQIDSITWNKTTVLSTDIDSALNLLITKLVDEFDQDNKLIDTACENAGRKAAEIFRDPDRGPYFLAQVLTANTNEGGNMSGYIQRLDNYAGTCEKNIETLTRTLAEKRTARKKLAESMQGFGQFKRNLDNFKEYVKVIWKDELQIKLYQKLKDEYYVSVDKRIGICYRIRNMMESNYLSRTDILSRIGEILSKNADDRRADVFENTVSGSIFGLTDPMFSTLKNSVRMAIESKLRNFTDQDVSQFAGALLGDMFNPQKDWSLHGVHAQQTAPAAESLRNFIYNYEAFKDITMKTFTDYFEEAYRNETDGQKDNIVHRIRDYLQTKAAPMCNVYTPFSWVDVRELCYRFMIIPNNMGDEWGNRFTVALTGNNQNVLLSPDQNAIYNYTLYAAMPIWIHGDLAKYEKAYYSSTDPGVHINESIRMIPPYFDYPPLMPKQQWHRAKVGSIDYVNEHEVAFYTKLTAQIKKALAAGVICKNDQENYVLELLQHRPTEEEWKEFFEDYTKDSRNVSSDNLLLGGEHLRAAMKGKFGVVMMEIYPIRSLKVDNVENLPDLIRRQMKLIGKLNDEMKYMADSVEIHVSEHNKVQEEENRLHDFANFLLYGLIDAEKGMWRYHLGERVTNIVSRLAVGNDSNTYIYTDYMEIMAYKHFYQIANNNHLSLLRQRIKDMTRLIIEGNTAVYNIINSNIEKYAQKASKVIGKFKDWLDDGGSLTIQEKEIEEFYQKILAKANKTKNLFVDDE